MIDEIAILNSVGATAGNHVIFVYDQKSGASKVRRMTLCPKCGCMALEESEDKYSPACHEGSYSITCLDSLFCGHHESYGYCDWNEDVLAEQANSRWADSFPMDELNGLCLDCQENPTVGMLCRECEVKNYGEDAVEAWEKERNYIPPLYVLVN